METEISFFFHAESLITNQVAEGGGGRGLWNELLSVRELENYTPPRLFSSIQGLLSFYFFFLLLKLGYTLMFTMPVLPPLVQFCTVKLIGQLTWEEHTS